MQVKEEDEEGNELTRYEIYELAKETRPGGGIGATTKLEDLGFGDPKIEKIFDLDEIFRTT